jgi:hypothetical protein
MILYYGYDPEVESLQTLKDQLETQETLDTLRAMTRQPIDTFKGTTPVVHAPEVNYVIGHGIGGMAIDWMNEDDFAQQLIEERGLRSGDVLCLIICSAGKTGGAAEQLANCIGARGVEGVTVRGPDGYINWNAHGELLVTDYGFKDGQLEAAKKAWVKAEDAAWRTYVGMLKAAITDAIVHVSPDRAATLEQYVLAFADARPDDNKKNAINGLVAKLQGAEDDARLKTYKNIVAQSAHVPEYGDHQQFNRNGTHQRWSAELRGLLTDLLVLADPAKGPVTARERISACRRGLRNALSASWPAYSTGYYDRIRTLSQGTDKQSHWKEYVSKLPSVADQPATAAQEVDTTFTDTELADLLAQIDAL